MRLTANEVRANREHTARINAILEQRRRILAIRDGPLLTAGELMDKLDAEAKAKAQQREETQDDQDPD